MKPFFSIIIPTLNEERYLPFLLSSIAGQLYKNFEVIIVDGNSSDNTLHAAKSFKHLIPKLLCLKNSKKNVSFQRNNGANVSRGAYVLFIDADVRIPEDFLSGIYEHLQHNTYELMTTKLTSPDTKIINKLLTTIANILLVFTNTIGMPTAGGFNIIIKKSIFMKMKGFNEQIVYGEDHDLIHRCYKNGIRLYVLNHPRLVCSYRRFEKYGYVKVLFEFIYASVHGRLKGPIREHLFEYKMGGDQ